VNLASSFLSLDKVFRDSLKSLIDALTAAPGSAMKNRRVMFVSDRCQILSLVVAEGREGEVESTWSFVK
jgi:hypothetical protein